MSISPAHAHDRPSPGRRHGYWRRRASSRFGALMQPLSLHAEPSHVAVARAADERKVAPLPLSTFQGGGDMYCRLASIGVLSRWPTSMPAHAP